MDAAVAGGKLSFKAPGDDLLCGELAPAAPPPPAPKGRYEVVHSDNPITGQNFAAQEPVPGAPAPAAPGTAQSFDLPPQLKRYVAIRAVDEQGNVGRAAVMDTGAPPGGGGPGGPGGSGGTAGAGGPGGSGAPGEQGDGQQQQQDPPPRCVPRKLKGSSRGLGGIAIGQTRDGITRALGRPSLQNARAFQYCVDGGGTVRIVFSRKGRVAFIASTAPSHRHGKIHPGSSKRAFKRNFPRSRHRGKGRFLHRRRLLFGIRGRGVRYVGTVDRGLSKSRGLLGGYVRLAGL
jgi:hypothetical protein